MWSAIVLTEFASRLQGRVAYAILTFMVAVFTALTLAAFWLVVSTVPTIVPVIGSSVGSGPSTTLPNLVMGYRGTFLFFAMAISLLTALSVVTPAVASSGISAEREERTFDLLLTSGAATWSTVVGKIIAASLFVGLLAITGAPGFAVAWFYGGVAWPELALTLLVIASATVFFASLAVCISSFAGSSLLAALYTYGAVFLVTFGSLAVYLIGASVQFEPFVRPALLLNPFSALVSVPDQVAAQLAQVLPLQYRPLLEQPALELSAQGPRLPRWAVTVAIYLVGSGLLAMVTAVIMDPCHRWKSRRAARLAVPSEAR